MKAGNGEQKNAWSLLNRKCHVIVIDPLTGSEVVFLGGIVA